MAMKPHPETLKREKKINKGLPEIDHSNIGMMTTLATDEWEVL